MFGLGLFHKIARCVTSCAEFDAVKSAQLESSAYRIKLASSGKKKKYILLGVVNLHGLATSGLFEVLLSHCLMHFPVSFSVGCNFLVFIKLSKG